ncbi:MAG: tripartite tricarboxylate transporter TctB family protein [Planctomycetaceae bacterium]|nr:tripartite tricarboxylate transporter TctB family protein [Planctomycetaceae bacterium]
MSESKRNIAVSLFFLAVSGIFWKLVDIGVRHSSTFSGNSPMLDSHFFPKFTAALLAVSSLACLLGSAYSLHRERKAGAQPDTGVKAGKQDDSLPPADDVTVEEEDHSWRGEMRVVGLFLLFIVYALLFKSLGYLYTTVIVSSAVLVLLRCRTWWYFPASWLFGAIVYYAFTELLYVPLP